jgi:hypothetical protein
MPRAPTATRWSRSRSKNASSNRSRSNLGLPSVVFPGRAAARAGGHAQVEVGPGALGLELLPAPKPDEVVAVLDQEVEVGAEVQLLRGLGAARAGAHAVVQVVPDVRAGQIRRLLVGGVAGCGREVAWVGRRDRQGSMGSLGSPPGVGRGVHDVLCVHAGTVARLCLVASHKLVLSLRLMRFGGKVPGGNGSAGRREASCRVVDPG